MHTASEAFSRLFRIGSEIRDRLLDMPKGLVETVEFFNIVRKPLPQPNDAEQVLLVLAHPHSDVMAA